MITIKLKLLKKVSFLQAVLKKKGKSEFHIGYYRDDPQEKPVFLARNDSASNYTITPIADNIFGAV